MEQCSAVDSSVSDFEASCQAEDFAGESKVSAALFLIWHDILNDKK